MSQRSKKTFRMSALVAGLATAGGAGYLANQRPELTDKQVIAALLDRVEDARFRRQVQAMSRARGIEPATPSAPIMARASSDSPAPIWWRPLPADAHLCPVTGVPGIRVGGDDGRVGPEWEHTYLWLHPTDPTLRWAHFTGEPKNADPTRNGVMFVPGPDMAFVAFPYREVWADGTWNMAVDPTHYRRRLSDIDLENLAWLPEVQP